MQEDDGRTPLEKRILKSFEDEAGAAKPLSRRARQTKRSLEAYLKAGVLPRYMARLREIESATAAHRRRLERDYDELREQHADDAVQFARRWRAHAQRQPRRFAELNQLIHEHNEWYPVERNLPLDPRTRDYIKPAGRNYRRRELDSDWVLEQFPPRLDRGADAA